LNQDGICDELEGCGADDFVLHHGRTYRVLTVGGQCWFAENLSYVPRESAIRVWDVDRPHAYVVGDSARPSSIPDVLYNHKAVQQWNLCPSGWRIPSDLDWMELEKVFGMPSDVVLERGARSWDPVLQASLWSRFAEEHEGIRYGDGSIERHGTGGGFWTTTAEGPSHAWYRLYDTKEPGLHRNYIFGKPTGLSVRCLRND